MYSVEKDQFNKLVDSYADSTVEDAKEILNLKESYPYSQLLHALSARLTKDHGFSNHQSELQLAAVYAADRSVLKAVLTSILESAPVTYKAETVSVAESSDKKVTTSNAHDVAEEVMEDLHRLHELKHHFEELFIDTDAKVKSITTEEEPVDNTVVLEEKKETKKEEKKIVKKSSSKSKRQRIIEMARALQEEESSHEETESSGKKKPEDKAETLIEEIEFTRQQISPENDRQKEQIQIIDQFIRAQPSISNSKDKPPVSNTGDLSTVKSGEFGDNIVSETLVGILLQQGKKDKAIEVLKKLIWKFPQKKAYFAAQIEDLKK